METLFVIAAKWPPEYGGPGQYYKKHIRQISRIAERVRIVGWSRNDVIDLEGAPPNVSAITLRPWPGRLGRHMSGIRLVCRLWRETSFSPDADRECFSPEVRSASAGDRSRYVPQHWAFPDAVTALLPYGVDLRAYEPPNTEQRLVARDSIGMPNDGLAAVSFGALHERKGELPLVDAWLRWVERGQRHGSRLFLVGPPSDADYVASIQRRLAEATPEAARTVILAGFCSDTAKYLRAADVYLSAARAEGLPISIVEALASGVPVVCRALEGVTNDFLHGQAVTAIPDWNVDAVSQAVDALSVGECRANASRDARTVAEARFDIAKRLDVIDRLLTGAPPLTYSDVS